MYRFTLIFCLLAGAFHGVITRVSILQLDGRIVGGKDATVGQFPHQVSLRYYGNHRCGGSIYKKNVVVTAGHCVEGTSTNQLAIVAGITFSHETGVQRFVQKVLHNKKFSSLTHDNDVALLILERPLEYSSSIQPIEFAESDGIVAAGSLATVSGWGASSEGGNLSESLKYAQVAVVSQEMCNSVYGGIVTQSMICAGSGAAGRDACQGDSGGPLVVDGKLVGIVSWGYGCAHPEYPGVYTRISAVRQWIDDQLFIFGAVSK